MIIIVAEKYGTHHKGSERRLQQILYSSFLSSGILPTHTKQVWALYYNMRANSEEVESSKAPRT